MFHIKRWQAVVLSSAAGVMMIGLMGCGPDEPGPLLHQPQEDAPTAPVEAEQPFTPPSPDLDEQPEVPAEPAPDFDLQGQAEPDQPGEDSPEDDWTPAVEW